MAADVPGTESDWLIVGGGVVGLSVAWGLVLRGQRVTVVDGPDRDHRASRGNFGLVWVQGKGVDAPHYARWTRRSVAAWRGFADDLEHASGEALSLEQRGGLDIHFDDASLGVAEANYQRLRAELDGDYPYERLDASALRRIEPEIGPEVCGALFHPEDGQVNPLRLLGALASAVQRNGGHLHSDCAIERIDADGGGFVAVDADGRRFSAGRIALCAGLGAIRLGPQLGFAVPIQPLRGQVLITERMPPVVGYPSVIARQVDNGGIQLGDSKEPVGFDDGTTLDICATIAARAIRAYPALAKARMLRSWGALRVMSPDGLPIYQQSSRYPGAFFLTCHSGITLAAGHARFLSEWLDDASALPDLAAFSEARFDV
ncbi:unnamed protein product [Cyprideis torosa]|uniref:Uncharacterized protein n=1 Tax=Cyprideis torosa TaxID=163714 RepID=A0A7R8WV14_9CRUS|nr:unnamed protein product [Cyprideis torosa]CAG0909444.1 unnamed protein product [Cyprideis torosa]